MMLISSVNQPYQLLQITHDHWLKSNKQINLVENLSL